MRKFFCIFAFIFFSVCFVSASQLRGYESFGYSTEVKLMLDSPGDELMLYSMVPAMEIVAVRYSTPSELVILVASTIPGYIREVVSRCNGPT